MQAKLITGKGADINIRDMPDECIIYANIAGVLVSTDDVVIHFGRRNMADPQEGEGVAKVYLSFAHAKRLASALTQSLGFYEKAFGEISTEPAMKLTPEQLKEMGIQPDAK